MAHQKALVTEELEAVGMMTSSGAHDFSNLLAATQAGVYLLRKRGAEEALLSGIEEAVERGKALNHSLLSFAHDHAREKRLYSPNDTSNKLEVLLRHPVSEGPEVRCSMAP